MIQGVIHRHRHDDPPCPSWDLVRANWADLDHVIRDTREVSLQFNGKCHAITHDTAGNILADFTGGRPTVYLPTKDPT